MATPLELSRHNGATTIEMNTTEVVEAAGESSTSKQLARLLFMFGFFTLLMALATALYKLPNGVVFENHKRAYYLTLAGIFAAGLAEVSIAVCLSGSGESEVRLGKFARAVLICASVVVLAAVIALSGFAAFIKG